MDDLAQRSERISAYSGDAHTKLRCLIDNGFRFN